MNKKTTIVADNKIPFLKGALEPYAEMRYLPAKEISRDAVMHADALITRTRTQCNAQLLEGTAVKFIATATIGFDHIDDAYCKAKNIRWVNAPGCNSSSVMQYIGSALLTLAKEKGFRLAERTIGVVGVGNVGKKVASLAEVFGMKLFCCDPPRMRAEKNLKFVSMDDILANCDIITFHVPLTKEGVDKTYHIADESLFSRMKKGTIVMNTSRGGVVNTESLKGAIKSGQIAAAVLDVWEHEPDIDRELMNMVDIATPHIAGYSADGKANGTSVCVRAVNDFLGLGAPSSWYPEIPSLNYAKPLKIECSGKSFQEILYEAILPTYEIRCDDARFRNSPGTFEQQRNEYPLRREYPYYEINLANANSGISSALRNLGFTLNTSTMK